MCFILDCELVGGTKRIAQHGVGCSWLSGRACSNHQSAELCTMCLPVVSLSTGNVTVCPWFINQFYSGLTFLLQLRVWWHNGKMTMILINKCRFINNNNNDMVYSAFRRLSLRWLFTYRDSLPNHRRSPIQVLSWPDIEQLHWLRSTCYH